MITPVIGALAKLAAFLFVAAVFVFWVFGDAPPTEAEMLAGIDAGTRTPSSSEIQKYERALKAAESACVLEADASHADYATITQELLAREGIHTSILSILQTLNGSRGQFGGANVLCADMYVDYAVARIRLGH